MSPPSQPFWKRAVARNASFTVPAPACTMLPSLVQALATAPSQARRKRDTARPASFAVPVPARAISPRREHAT